MYMPGATAVGITFDGGVVFASEKRIAFGNFLVSKSTKKTFSITSKVGATCAGLVADMQILTLQISALAKIAKKYKIQLINDNCHALGSKLNGDRSYATKYADFVIQSFHAVKNITTGEGGAILTNNDNWANKCQMIRNLGCIKKYHHEILGTNSRLDSIQAAVLNVKLKYLNKWNEMRNKIAEIYIKELSKINENI